MALTTSLAGSTRTVVFTYSSDNTKVLALMTNAAKWQYIVKGRYHVTITEGTPPDETTRDKTWNELTTAQKLSILDQAVREWILSWARSYNFNTNIPAATQAVQTTAEDTYAL